MNTPVSLLERLRRPQDREAWARFVGLYTPLLFHWARRVGLQQADAADLVQEVLTVLFRKLPGFTYDKNRSFRSWLRTVTLNKWREGQRRRVRVQTGSSQPLDEVPAPDQMAILEETEYRRHLVDRALEALRSEFPAMTWKVFDDYVLADQPAEEVAARHGILLGTVYAAKSRVLSRLREELAGLFE